VGESAKAVLSARRVDYVAVAQAPMEPNEDLRAWTGVVNAPVAVFEDEAPALTWLDILLLAERLGSGPPLLPEDPLQRALVLGFSTEICAPDGFGWARRLELMGRSTTINPVAAGARDMGRMVRMYGARPEAIARAPGRMAAIMTGLATQLHRQRAAGSAYLVGEGLTACDLYWACFSLFVAPLAQADSPMPEFMVANYSYLPPEVEAAFDPVLLEHRDLVFRKHIGLPLDY
jgi:glutathione S-transferase